MAWSKQPFSLAFLLFRVFLVFLVFLVSALPVAVFAQTPGRVTTVASFTPPALPEGLALDPQGTIYVSMATTGEIRRLTVEGASSTFATLRPGSGFLFGLAFDAAGTLYAALASGNSPESDAHGVWRIGRDGSPTLFAALPADTLPNGLAFDRQGNLFVSDSVGGSIWRITSGGQASLWLTHPLLRADERLCPPNPLPAPVGVNGIAFDRTGALVFVNTLNASLGRIPVNANGSAGSPVVTVGPDCARLKGADGIALDRAGNVYVANNMLDTVVRVTPLHAIETLATGADGLDFPASLAFGTGRTQNDLYVTNFAVLAALGGGTPRPGLLRMTIAPTGAVGLPRTGDRAGTPAGSALPWRLGLGGLALLSAASLGVGLRHSRGQLRR